MRCVGWILVASCVVRAWWQEVLSAHTRTCTRAVSYPQQHVMQARNIPNICFFSPPSTQSPVPRCSMRPDGGCRKGASVDETFHARVAPGGAPKFRVPEGNGIHAPGRSPTTGADACVFHASTSAAATGAVPGSSDGHPTWREAVPIGVSPTVGNGGVTRVDALSQASHPTALEEGSACALGSHRHRETSVAAATTVHAGAVGWPQPRGSAMEGRKDTASSAARCACDLANMDGVSVEGMAEACRLPTKHASCCAREVCVPATCEAGASAHGSGALLAPQTQRGV